MDSGLNRADRTAVMAAFLAPVVGLPLVGPWALHAILPDDSPARPHVARAFDLHLGGAVIAAALYGLGSIFFGFATGEIIAVVFFSLVLIAGFVLLAGIIRGSRWSAPWNPVFLGRHSFYYRQSFDR